MQYGVLWVATETPSGEEEAQLDWFKTEPEAAVKIMELIEKAEAECEEDYPDWANDIILVKVQARVQGTMDGLKLVWEK